MKRRFIYTGKMVPMSVDVQLNGKHQSNGKYAVGEIVPSCKRKKK